MKLSNYLEGKVKIGAVNGSAYFYCGPAELCDIPVLNEKIKTYWAQKVKAAEDEFETHSSVGKGSVRNYNIAVLKTKRRWSYKDYEEWLERYFKEHQRLYDHMVETTAKQARSKPLEKRKVVEVTQACDGSLIILVEGEEAASSWDESEYKGEI